MVLAKPVCHESMFWLKALAPLNMLLMSTTALVFQELMSTLNSPWS